MASSGWPPAELGAVGEAAVSGKLQGILRRSMRTANNIHMLIHCLDCRHQGISPHEPGSCLPSSKGRSCDRRCHNQDSDSRGCKLSRLTHLLHTWQLAISARTNNPAIDRRRPRESFRPPQS